MSLFKKAPKTHPIYGGGSFVTTTPVTTTEKEPESARQEDTTAREEQSLPASNDPPREDHQTLLLDPELGETSGHRPVKPPDRGLIKRVKNMIQTGVRQIASRPIFFYRVPHQALLPIAQMEFPPRRKCCGSRSESEPASRAKLWKHTFPSCPVLRRFRPG